MNKRFWGKADGRDIWLMSLSNGILKADVTNYGAAIVSLQVPDKNGGLVDVVMGFDSLEEYIDQKYYVGVTIGRCANRIKNARFVLNGEEFLLDRNEGKNHLHGGRKGFWNVGWEIAFCGSDYVVLKYRSSDGECGYPGNLDCTIEYRLEGAQLKILYSGTADRDTVMSLTNHSYFNLNGHAGGTIEDHIVSIEADRFTEIDMECGSTGNIMPVEDTPFDLRKPARIGDMLRKMHYQMEYGSGFNHNYILNSERGLGRSSEDGCGSQSLAAAELYSPESGIGMKVYTDMEGMHFYTGNYLDGSLRGKNGAVYRKYGALCFETQHFPNAVNIEHFPSPVISKDEEKRSRTAFEFYLRQPEI